MRGAEERRQLNPAHPDGRPIYRVEVPGAGLHSYGAQAAVQMQSKATSISSYLKSLGKNERAVIETLDQLVRTAAPGATGSMKYGMPTYDVSGRTIAFNAQKNYYSFYADPAVVKRYRAELGPVDCGKSCIRFRKLEEVSLDALKKIVLEHAK